MSLRVKTFQSGVAVTVSSLIVQFFRIISLIILARLLTPADIGVFSLALIIIGFTNLYSGMGMGAAIIATSEDTEKAAFHALLITLSVGLLLAASVAASAGAIASFFDSEELAAIVRFGAIMILFSAIVTIPNALLQKEMLFNRLIIPATAGPLSNMTLAVTLAYLGFGLWSLVIAAVFGSFVSLMITIAVCPSLRWLVPRRWDRLLATSLARFGTVCIGTGAIQYTYNNADELVVGRVFGTTSLGFYGQAYSLSNLPVESISRVVNSVLLPAYAAIRDDKERLAKAFLSSFRMLSVVTVPFAMGLLILAPELILFMIGEKWRDSTPILQVFAFLSLLRPLSGATSPLFLALKRPGYNFRTAVLQGVSMAVLIFILLDLGTSGVALAVVISFALGFVHNIYLACWRTGVPIRPSDLLVQIWPVLLSTIIMMAVVLSLKHPFLGLAGGVHNAFSLGGLVLTGMAAYGLSLLVTSRRLVFDILKLAASAAHLVGRRAQSSGA